MAYLIVLLPALVCVALALVVNCADIVRAVWRDAVLLDLIGDVFIQLMVGGPVIAYLLGLVGLDGPLDAHPGVAVAWMVLAVHVAYKFKRAARRREAVALDA